MPLNSRVQQQQGRATGGLSARDETAAAATEADSEDSGFCANALPTAAGGGIAFPRGVTGRAYRLEAEAFADYCARQGARERRARDLEARAYGFRDMKVVAFSLAVVLLLRSLPNLLNETGLPAAPVYAAVALFCIGALAYRALRAPRWFAAAFPGSQSLSFVKQWAAVARLDRARNGLNAFWYRTLRIVTPLFIAGTAAIVQEQDASLLFLIRSLLVLSAVEALLALAFHAVYLPIRLGWRPAVEDLEPR